MTDREKLHDILENGTDRQIEALVTLLLLARYGESERSQTPGESQSDRVTVVSSNRSPIHQ